MTQVTREGQARWTGRAAPWVPAAVTIPLPLAGMARATLAALAYLAIPLALGWFAFVLIDSAPSLRPQEVRFPTTTAYDPYFDDFVVFYAAGTMVRAGEGGGVYNLDAINAAEGRTLGEDPEGLMVLPYFNPPAVALPLAALSALPFEAAAVAWTVGGMAIFVAAVVLVLRARPSRPRGTELLALAGGIAACWPFYQNILHGQMTFVLFAGWAMFWLGAFAGRGTRWTVAGLVLIAIKPQFAVLPAAYLLAVRDWKPLLAFAGVELVANAAAIVATGPGVVLAYPALLLQAAGWDEMNGISIHGMFGLNALAEGLLGPGAEGARSAVTWGLVATTLAALAIGGRRLHSQGRRDELFAAIVFAALLISPHLYGHDVLLGVLPLLVLATASRQARVGWAAFGAVGWFVLYWHFEILDATGLNAGALLLAAAFGLALAQGALRLPAFARGAVLRPIQQAGGEV